MGLSFDGHNLSLSLPCISILSKENLPVIEKLRVFFWLEIYCQSRSAMLFVVYYQRNDRHKIAVKVPDFEWNFLAAAIDPAKLLNWWWNILQGSGKLVFHEYSGIYIRSKNIVNIAWFGHPVDLLCNALITPRYTIVHSISTNKK